MNIPCPSCNGTDRNVEGGKVTCRACRRLIGWEGSNITQTTKTTESTNTTKIANSTTTNETARTLYLSKKLDYFDPLASDKWAEVVTIGSEVYYRVTPEVFAWFERAISSKLSNPKTPNADRAELSRVMSEVVLPFASVAFHADAIAVARKAGGSLPAAPWVPIIAEAAPRVFGWGKLQPKERGQA